MKTRILSRATIAVAILASAMASCTHAPQQPIATVSFKKDIIPIMQTSCAINSSCHAGANNANANIDLDSNAAYNTIISHQLVNTSKPTASLLYVEISSGLMPKPPYSPLPAAQVTLILNWIQQGATNN